MNDVAAQFALEAKRGWSARLALAFRRREDRTLLARREHEGPLVVQKALHPEGAAVCQAIVVHPPGGIAGGDRLALDVDVGERAHAQLTTPGAAKWYRSSGRDASHALRVRVAAGGVLEWLPQEAIVFDGALAKSTTTIALEADAVFIGWDVVCLGRTHSGERFAGGLLAQSAELVRDGALLWADRWVVEGGSRALQCSALLGGAPVFGTLTAAADIGDDLFASCRQVACSDGDGAVTRLPGVLACSPPSAAPLRPPPGGLASCGGPSVLIARYRGHSAAAARTYFANLWGLLRPALAGRAAVPPRIWNT